MNGTGGSGGGGTSNTDGGRDSLDGGSNDAPDGSGDVATPPVGAPRLLAPISTGTVTSRRPRFRMVVPAGADGALIQVCRDRPCAQIVQSLTTTTATAVPTSDLPTGVLFWRAFGTKEGATGNVSSPTWEITVGVHTAAADTSFVSTLDVNGDGFADAVLGDCGAELAAVYLGSPSGLAASPAIVLPGPDGASAKFGCSVSNAGDVDGDGYADVIVGASGAALNTGRAYIYRGGPTGPNTVPSFVLNGSSPGGGFGAVVAGVGDADGDGYGEVAVSSIRTTGTAGTVVVDFGGARGFDLSRTTPLPDPAHHGAYGSALAAAGDINGDGFDDIAIGAASIPGDMRAISIFFGSASGIGGTPIGLAEGSPTESDLFAASIAGGGDLNGDGLADVIVGAPRAGQGFGQIFILFGSASGSITITPGPQGIAPTSAIGSSVAFAGDLDGDGLTDVAATGGTSTSTGYLFLARSPGLGSPPQATVPKISGNAYGPGDVNGDGYGDILFGAQLYLGTGGGIALAPSTTLDTPDAGM